MENKICTTVEQSEKLIKLGIDKNTSDMYYELHSLEDYYCPIPLIGKYSSMHSQFPAWSLTALLHVLPQTVRLVGTSKDSYWYCECVSANNQEYAGFGSADNPIDACYEMIIKLHRLNKLVL